MAAELDLSAYDLAIDTLARAIVKRVGGSVREEQLSKMSAVNRRIVSGNLVAQFNDGKVGTAPASTADVLAVFDDAVATLEAKLR